MYENLGFRRISWSVGIIVLWLKSNFFILNYVNENLQRAENYRPVIIVLNTCPNYNISAAYRLRCS